MDLPVNKIICDDCMNILKQLPDKSVDLCLCDPPYGVGLKGKYGQNNKGYKAFEDTSNYAKTVVIPIIKRCLQISKRVVLTPGIKNCFLYPQPDSIGGVYCPAPAGINKWGFTGIHPILYYGKDPQKGCYPNSFASSEISEKFDHPCPKPIGWMLWLVKRASEPGDLILDPFCGSGTTCLAAATSV